MEIGTLVASNKGAKTLVLVGIKRVARAGIAIAPRQHSFLVPSLFD